MKKSSLIILAIIIVGLILLTVFILSSDNFENPGLETETNNQIQGLGAMHPSWDQDGDGINDCEKEGICDDSVDYTKPRSDSMQSELINNQILNLLMGSATITVPDTDVMVTLTGKTTQFGDFNIKTEPYGTITFGNIAMPYPYYKDGKEGPGVVTTLAINYGGSGELIYLTVFLPGENTWEMVDMELLGDRVNVKELKVEGEDITVNYMEHDEGQAMAEEPTKEVIKTYTVIDNQIISK